MVPHSSQWSPRFPGTLLGPPRPGRFPVVGGYGGNRGGNHRRGEGSQTDHDGSRDSGSTARNPEPGRHGTARTVRGLARAPEEETRHPEINKTGGCPPVSPGHSQEVLVVRGFVSTTRTGMRTRTRTRGITMASPRNGLNSQQSEESQGGEA